MGNSRAESEVSETGGDLSQDKVEHETLRKMNETINTQLVCRARRDRAKVQPGILALTQVHVNTHA